MQKMLSDFDSILFEMLSQSSRNVFFFYSDFRNNINRWSKSSVEYFGLPGEYLDTIDYWYEKIHPDDIGKYMEDIEQMFAGKTDYHNAEYRITNAQGEYVWVNCRGKMIFDENRNPIYFAGFVTNMGAISKIDPVTGLFSKHGFRNDLTVLLDKKHPGVAMQLDLCNFKRINSRYGYDFGDIVLFSLGKKLSAICNHKARVYRMDGAQFAILMEGDTDDLIKLYPEITAVLRNFSVNNIPLHLDIRSGATVFPKDGEFIDQIRSNLYYALANAKQLVRKDIVFYNKELYEQRNRITHLTDALRESIDNNFEGFRLVFQPIINSKTGELYSAEALLRWSHPAFPKIGPMDFIPILEETENIIPVGRWILDEAFRNIAKWNETGKNQKLKHVNINFSYIQFKDPTLKNYILDRLDTYKLPHDLLVAELTESCHVNLTDELGQIFKSLQNEGIQIALDDFGTGYSSLVILKDLPTDIVKLDFSMTRHICTREKDRSLVEFIINYCNHMNIKICTEGIEEAEALRIVTDAGTDLIQGYYYDKPLELDAFFEKYMK